MVSEGVNSAFTGAREPAGSAAAAHTAFCSSAWPQPFERKWRMPRREAIEFLKDCEKLDVLRKTSTDSGLELFGE